MHQQPSGVAGSRVATGDRVAQVQHLVPLQRDRVVGLAGEQVLRIDPEIRAGGEPQLHVCIAIGIRHVDAEPFQRVDHDNGEREQRPELILLVDGLAQRIAVVIRIVAQHVAHRGMEQAHTVRRAERVRVRPERRVVAPIVRAHDIEQHLARLRQPAARVGDECHRVREDLRAVGGGVAHR